MNRFNLPAAAALLLGSATLTGCIDNGYDLSDIDTTTQVKISNLTLPLQLEPVVLSDIIELDDSEDEKVKLVTINGQTFYAVEESGSYHSDPIKINEFNVYSDQLEPTHAEFIRINVNKAPRRNRRSGGTTVDFTLRQEVPNTLSYDATSIDASIHSLTHISFTTANFTIKLKMNSIPGVQQTALRNVKLNIPKGLTLQSAGFSYDPATGILTIPELAVSADGTARIVLPVSGIDLKANGILLDYPTHSMSLHSNFNIEEADLVLTLGAGSSESSLPTTLSFDVSYAFDDLHVTDIDGSIEYNIDGSGLNIEPITLNDLPDFLAGDGTNLILANPQIYLDINNPVAGEKLTYQSGLNITVNRDGKPSRDITLDRFTVGCSNGTGPYHYCLSPKRPTDVPQEFQSGLEWVEYPNLGTVLSGEGIPQSLKVSLVDPKIPLTDVKGMAIGRNLPRMEGSYRFLAPLALAGDATSGSVIVYTDRNDGWNDEDVDKIEIDTMVLACSASSTLPLNATLTAHPLDKDGHIINNVSVEGATLPANADNHDLRLNITGEIRHLDGVEFTATVRPDGSEAVLEPGMTITLKNIRVTVNGNYTTDF